MINIIGIRVVNNNNNVYERRWSIFLTITSCSICKKEKENSRHPAGGCYKKKAEICCANVCPQNGSPTLVVYGFTTTITLWGWRPASACCFRNCYQRFRRSLFIVMKKDVHLDDSARLLSLQYTHQGKAPPP